MAKPLNESPSQNESNRCDTPDHSKARDPQGRYRSLPRRMKYAAATLVIGLPLLMAIVIGESTSDEIGPVLFQCDFESETWWKDWGEKTLDTHATTVTTDVERKFEPHRGRALRIAVDQGGHYGLSLSFRFQRQLGHEPEEIYFRFYIRLADDWDPERGGKFPGIGGTYGRAGWGGRRVNGTDGWSARGLFKGQQSGTTPIGFYCYHADMKGTYGDNFVWDDNGFQGLENNRWYCIEQFAKMNTPGKNDGVLRAWVDGKPVFERQDIRMRDVSTLKIETIWLNVYYGGTWTAVTPHHLYIDDVEISRQRIGPIR